MPTKQNPGAFNCYAAAMPDEPIFTILGRDLAGPATLAYWVRERIKHNKDVTEDDQARITAALAEAQEMKAWRKRNVEAAVDDVMPWNLPKQFIGDDNTKPPTQHFVFEGCEGEYTLADLAEIIQQHEGRVNQPTPVSDMVQEVVEKIDAALAKHPSFFPRPLIDGIRQDLLVGCIRGEKPFEPGDDDTGMAEKIATGLEQVRTDFLNYVQDPVQMRLDYDDWQRIKQQAEVFADRISGYAAELEMFGLPKAPVAEVIVSGLVMVKGKPTTIKEIEEHFAHSGRPHVYQPERTVGKSPVFGMGYTPDTHQTPAVDAYKEFASKTRGEQVLVDDKPDDLAHAPEVPPHRFSQFTKGERYAYARGLEVAPMHLPTALDAMALDGWDVICVFGQTNSKEVGFLFQKRPKPMVIWDKYDTPAGLSWADLKAKAEKAREGTKYARFASGEPLDAIRDADDTLPTGSDAIDLDSGLIGRGRGLEP